MSIYILFFLLLSNLKESTNMLLRGKRAHDGQFPWLIQFQTIIPCGGVLLSSDWVLTAAQCVQEKRNSIALLATGLNGTGSIQTIFVKATYIHPHYEAHSAYPDRDYNVALLKLIEPFDMCNAKINLPTVVPVRYEDNYKSCLIFGWQSYISPSSKVLAKPIQYSEVILNSWKLCAYMINANANYTNVFCTMVEFKDDIKACAGNPGSPVICENQYRQTALLGIASWTNFSLECGVLPTYTDLDEFRIWMHDIMFNKRTEQRNDGSNGKQFQFQEKHDTYERSQTDADTLQANYWLKDAKMQLKNMSTIVTIYQNASTSYMNITDSWNRSYLPFHSNFSDTNTSSDGRGTLYPDAMDEPSNNIYRYEEVGEIKSSRDGNQTVRTLGKCKGFGDPSKSLCNEKFQATTMEYNGDRIEADIEFLLPFDYEDTTISYSSITVTYCKTLYIVCFILYVFYIIIYI